MLKAFLSLLNYPNIFKAEGMAKGMGRSFTTFLLLPKISHYCLHTSREYLRARLRASHDLRDAPTVLTLLPAAFEYFNEEHLH